MFANLNLNLKKQIYLLLFRHNKIVSKTGLKKYIKYCLSPIQPSERKRFSPIAWEILDNMNYLTFTLFEADEEVDNGKIYTKLKVELKGTELNEEIKNIQAETTYTMILDYISQYPKNKSQDKLVSQHITRKERN